jgi:hypothetical protein
MLTQAQLLILKNDIIADPVLNAYPNTGDGAYAIAMVYNLQAVPDFTVWKTNVPTEAVKQGTVWTEFIGRSAGERDAYQFMLSNGWINAADPNIRQGINDIFSGPNGVGTRANLVAIAKRLATRVEKLFATGTGTNASPATMTFEGSLSFQDVLSAKDLP